MSTSPGPTVSALSLADFTSESLIVPWMRATNMVEALAELSECFRSLGKGWDVLEMSRAAIMRERQMSTAMDFGAAFPHARSPAYPDLRFAFGRFIGTVRWEDGAKVDMVFLNAVPGKDAGTYLKLVAAMARLGMDVGLLKDLKSAAGGAGILQVLKRVPVKM